MVVRLSRLLALSAGLMALAVWCGADFSADVVTKGGRVNTSGKLYCQGKKMRRETTTGPRKQIIIIRPDKKVTWILDPVAKTYVEMSWEKIMGRREITDEAELKKMATIKVLGAEKVNGYVCEKRQITFKDKRMGTATQWFSKALKYPIKMENKTPMGPMVTECKNIHVGSLSASVFEVPKGYKKVARPMGFGPGMHGGGMHRPGMRGMPTKPK